MFVFHRPPDSGNEFLFPERLKPQDAASNVFSRLIENASINSDLIVVKNINTAEAQDTIKEYELIGDL